MQQAGEEKAEVTEEIINLLLRARAIHHQNTRTSRGDFIYWLKKNFNNRAHRAHRKNCSIAKSKKFYRLGLREELRKNGFIMINMDLISI